MQIVYKQVDDLIPYVNNARKNDQAVDAVASSIKNYGFKQPIVIDNQGEVVAGHTRLKAAKKLGLKEVPVIIADDLTPAQVKAYRIADNRVGELAEWDMELLQLELDGLEEFTGFENSFDDVINDVDKNVYTDKIEIPKYEIKGDKPELFELVNKEKTNELIKKINSSKLKIEEKEFILLAASRFYVFDYAKIAEYYSHSEKDVQEMFEMLALVIIDFDKAISNGFIDFVDEVMEGIECDDE
jgi:hypothetical protein